MKNLFTIFIVSLLGLAMHAQEPSSAQMKFETVEHNFGRIGNRSDVQSHTFKFINTGKTPLVVLNVETSCKCTKAVYPNHPIMPGKGGDVVITYDPKRQKGVFYKAIQVFTNEPGKRHIVTVKGEVFKQ